MCKKPVLSIIACLLFLPGCAGITSGSVCEKAQIVCDLANTICSLQGQNNPRVALYCDSLCMVTEEIRKLNK